MERQGKTLPFHSVRFAPLATAVRRLLLPKLGPARIPRATDQNIIPTPAADRHCKSLAIFTNLALASKPEYPPGRFDRVEIAMSAWNGPGLAISSADRTIIQATLSADRPRPIQR
jgi:hypothetical protein